MRRSLVRHFLAGMLDGAGSSGVESTLGPGVRRGQSARLGIQGRAVNCPPGIKKARHGSALGAETAKAGQTSEGGCLAIAGYCSSPRAGDGGLPCRRFESHWAP